MGCHSSKIAQQALTVGHSDENLRKSTLLRRNGQPRAGSDRRNLPILREGVSPSSKSVLSSQILYNYGKNPDQTQNSKWLELMSLVIAKAADDPLTHKDGQELRKGDEDGVVSLTQLRSKLGMQ